MKRKSDIEGQDFFLKFLFFQNTPGLEITLLFSILAFLYLCGCTRADYSHSYARRQETGNIFIFTFNDDPMMRLDSYQSYKMPLGNEIGIDSRSGDKVSIICANCHKEDFEWHDIQSYRHMGKLRFKLEDEDPDRPLACKEMKLKAGSMSKDISSDLEPFLSEIHIQSIKVDFSGQAYRGSSLSDIKVYLTNVNAEVSLFDTFETSPGRIINCRKLDEGQVDSCLYPQMLMRRIENIADGGESGSGFSLYCFPNSCITESLGSPFTRLVIEAEINGRKYWYPINVNRDGQGNGKGVERNCRYIYDICIRRLGSDDPDIPSDFGTISAKLVVKPWKELEGYAVTF